MHKPSLMLACSLFLDFFAMENPDKAILPRTIIDDSIEMWKKHIEFYKFNQSLSLHGQHPPKFTGKPPTVATKPLAKKLIDENQPQIENNNNADRLKIPLQKTNLKKNNKISLNPGAFTHKIRKR